MRKHLTLLLLNLALFLLRCVRYVHEATLEDVAVDAVKLALILAMFFFAIRGVFRIVTGIIILTGGLG
jgi:hypothetical protein